TRRTLGANGSEAATRRTIGPIANGSDIDADTHRTLDANGAVLPKPALAAAQPGTPTPPRRRFRFRWRLFALIAALAVIANEAQVISAASDFKRALPNLPRGESEAVWGRYRQLASRSVMGIGAFGLAPQVRDWFVSSADELMADYHSDTPVIRE